MKITTTLLLLAFNSLLTIAQVSPSAGRAAIVHSKFRSSDSGGIPNDTNALTTLQYFDGLGNPLQTVGYRKSPDKKDIVLNATTFDNQIRQIRSYIPFGTTASSGAYLTNTQATASNFYNDNKPYQEVLQYDNSSLDQIRIVRGAGAAWADNNRVIRTELEPSMTVKFITPDASGNLVYNNRTIPERKYRGQVVWNEDNKQTTTVQDSEGRTIHTQDGSNAITHYVYDLRDRLYAIIQPDGYDFGSAGITKDSEHWQKYVFAYEYDFRNRIVRKHIPGAGWTEIVYDNADRPVMQQDASQKVHNRWTFLQYDAFSREIARGETVKATTRAAAQALFNNHTSLYEIWGDHGYSELSFPSSLKPAPNEIERYYFYDTYGFIASEFAFKPTGAFHTPKASAKGLLTGISKRNSRDDSRYYTDTYYYDALNRLIQSQHTHALSTGNQQNVIVKNMAYNFAGELTKEHVRYPFPSVTVSSAQHNHYDHAGRVTHIDFGIQQSVAAAASPDQVDTKEAEGNMYSLGFKWPENGVFPDVKSEAGEKFNMPPITKIVSYTYDEIGRMTEKKFMPDGTFSLGNPDYISRPPSPSLISEDIARKAILLEPGTLIDSSYTYIARIDSTGNESLPFSGLQTMNYTWHIRGGLRGINLNGTGSPIPDHAEGDLFSYRLEYETAGQWAGNIGRQSWNHVNGENPAGLRNYTFTYDPSDRLKSAIYTSTLFENYGISNVNYDKNGNILQLRRSGKMGESLGSPVYGEMDHLSYSYFGNRLQNVHDAISGNHEVDFVNRGSGTYTYYENGALKSDENEQINNISYSTYLNQPEEIEISGDRWIKYTYDGNDDLIKTEYKTGEIREYVDKFIFRSGQPFAMAIPDGRAILANGQWQFEFDYKDHLGNTRVSFKAEGSRLVQTAKSDFDPWGVSLNGTGKKNDVENRHEMQGHEKEMTYNLNRVNFGARTYNPTIGRFDKADRFSEKYASLSTFQYSANNPLRYIDINGDSLWISYKGNKFLYNDGQLYNSDGSEFEGKMKGFLKQTFNALNQINSTQDGSSMLEDLSSSNNNFYITHASNNPVRPGSNEFVQFNRAAGYANAMREENQGNPISGGSGGMVYWNPNDGGVLELGGSIGIRPITNLGHELFHAFDANNGLLDNRPSQIGLERHEVRASFFENNLRKDLKYPYREFYNKKALGPVRLLDSKNQPINFPE